MKHTYLENTILSLDDELLKEHIAENATFVQHMTELANEVIDRLETDFDPSQLVDRLPLVDVLTVEERKALRLDLHERYRQEFRPAVVRRQIRESWLRFTEAFEVWINHATGSNGHSSVALAGLAVRAREFCDELAKLPRGIWI